MHTKADESSIQDLCRELTRLSVCAGKLLTKRATVTPTIPSVLYAHIVPLGTPYIES